jgi:hypothetical protein
MANAGMPRQVLQRLVDGIPLRDSNAKIHPLAWTGPTKGETMATSLYDLSVPTFLQTVRAVAGFLLARTGWTPT